MVTLTGRSIRGEYTPIFRSLDKQSNEKAGVILGSYIAVILLSIWLGIFVINSESHLSHLLAAPISLFIATRLRGINNIVHECSHLAFAKDKKWNMFYGRFASSLLFKSFKDYRQEHMTHHAHLGDYKNDLDFKTLQDFRLEASLTFGTIIRHLITPIAGLHLTRYFSINLSQNDGFGYAIVKAGLIYTTLVFAWYNWIAALVFVVFPYVWLLPAINYWTDCIDHAGLFDNGDELMQSRNVRVLKPIAWLFFPRNDAYHLVHHLFPAVPSQYFNQCHKTLMEHPSYRDWHKSHCPQEHHSPPVTQS